MSKRKKLLERLISNPKDFTYSELKALLCGLGYEKEEGTGSRVIFIDLKTKSIISLHKPHPGNILKNYQIEDILDELESRGVL